MPGSFIKRDLAAVFNADHFAVVGELIRASDDTHLRVRGIFDDEDVQLPAEYDEGRGQNIQSVRFTTSVEYAAKVDDILRLPVLNRDTGAEILQTFRVAEPEHDGTGVVTLHLEIVQ